MAVWNGDNQFNNSTLERQLAGLLSTHNCKLMGQRMQCHQHIL